LFIHPTHAPASVQARTQVQQTKKAMVQTEKGHGNAAIDWSYKEQKFYCFKP